MIQATTRMVNAIWKSEEIPHQWRRSDIKPIYKGKGTKEDLANYRGVFLSNTICKIFEKMVYRKLEPIIDEKMTEFQAGARKGRRTTDHILTLKTKVEYDQYIKRDTYVQFYDIVKCFDKLWLRDVMYDLGNNGVTGKMYRLIFLLNNRTRITVKTPYGNTEEYEIGELVRQGSVLGAVISANSLETVIKDAEYGHTETTMGDLLLYPLCFLDDIAAVSNSLLQARKNQTVIEVYQDRKRLQLHPEKSQYLIKEKHNKDEEEIIINDQKMKRTGEYRYLGEYITDKRVETTTVDKRIKEANGIMNEILAVVSLPEIENRRIEIGIKLAGACLDSKLLYNSETWIRIKNSDIKKLESAQYNFYKRLIRVPTGTPNIAITMELGILPMEYKIQKRKLMEYQRLMKMKQVRLTKKATMEAMEMGSRNLVDE